MLSHNNSYPHGEMHDRDSVIYEIPLKYDYTEQDGCKIIVTQGELLFEITQSSTDFLTTAPPFCWPLVVHVSLSPSPNIVLGFLLQTL